MDLTFLDLKLYGICVAAKFLHCCSPKKIKEFLCNHEVTLKPRQIKFVFNKDPDFVSFYFDNYQSVKGTTFSHREISQYIASRDSQLWLRLVDQNVLNSKTGLGHRTSKSFIRQNQTAFMRNIQSYSEFLKLNVIVRELHGNFGEVYFRFFPKNVDDLTVYNNFSHKLLKHYPNNRKWDMFARTYMRAFGDDILNNLASIRSDFTNLFPNRTVLNDWAKAHYDQAKSDAYLKNCDPKIAIPLIKERIDVTDDVSKRNELIALLLDNCSKNNDLISLKQVLKYICVHHRNQDTIPTVLSQVKYLFNLSDLNESHWNLINEMITFLRLKKNLSMRIGETLIVRHIAYLIAHEKPYRNHLIKYIEDIQVRHCWFDINIKNPAVEKQMWTEIIREYSEMPMEEKPLMNFQENAINSVISFNKTNPKHCIDISNFPKLFAYIKSIFDSYSQQLVGEKLNILENVVKYNFTYPKKVIIPIQEKRLLQILQDHKQNYKDIIKNMITKYDRSKFENDVLQVFWDNLSDWYAPIQCNTVIKWLFENEPRTIIPYFDQLLEIDQTCVDAKAVKLMSHLRLDEKLRIFCEKKLESINQYRMEALRNISDPDTDDNHDKKWKPKLRIDNKLFKNLPLLLTTSEYVEIVEKLFVPIKENIDIADEKLNELYYWQCKVAKSLRYVQEPTKVLPTLFKFCVGDYLQSAIRSLNNICYRAPEKMLYPYMEMLSKKSVATKKQALILTCGLLRYDYVLDQLQNAKDDNVSGQKQVISATVNYFCKNPTDALLDLVISNLDTVNKNDTETLSALMKADIPEKYTRLYLQKCWYFFEEMRKGGLKVKYYLQSCLGAISRSREILVSLPHSFCEHIINAYFTDENKDDHNLDNINDFVCKFLVYRESEQSSNYEYVFNIISEFKNNNRNTGLIKKFFSALFDVSRDNMEELNEADPLNNYHLELFETHWNSIFKITETFEEIVLLDLLYLRCKSSASFVENYAREIVTYLEELVDGYGPFVYYRFKDLILFKLGLSQKDKCLFLYNILKFKKTTLNCILVLDLLNTSSRNSKETKEIFEKIMKILKESEEPVVSLYYCKKFDTLNIGNDW